MFLTEKHRSVPIFPSPYRYHILSDPFNAALSSRLLSLLPIPVSSSASAHLSWLSRTCELLSLTISEAASLLLHHMASSHDPSPFLDSTSLFILDSCNSIFTFSDRLLYRILFVRCSLKSSKAMPILVEKKELPQLSAIRSLSLMEKSPRGEIGTVQNAICAVEALSALALGAIGVALSGKGKEYFEGLKVDAEIFAWGKEFNKVLEAASKRIGEGCVDEELEKMEASIRGLTAGMDLDGEMEKKMEIEEMERTSGEIRDRLEKLKRSVNAVFRAALCARNAAGQSLLAREKNECK